MTLPITPRSRTLAALSVARGTHMDTLTLRKWHATVAIFIVSWFILFSLFQTFYPDALLGDNDYISEPGLVGTPGTTANGVLSDAGRAIVWGASVGFAALVAFLYYFFYIQFF